MTNFSFSPRSIWIVAGLFFALVLAIPVAAQKDVSIAEVQGDKAKSPYENQQVRVHGVVTAQRRDGFYVQTPDDKKDDNPATSEGVYVYLGRDASTNAKVGDAVEVTGTVQEFMPRSESYGYTLTEIGRAEVKVLGSGNALPAAITLTPNDLVPNKLDSLEKYEGMRVRVDALTVTGPTGGRVDDKTGVATSDGVFFGVLQGTPRPVREAGADVYVAIGQKLPNTISWFDTNPEMLRVDSDGLNGGKPMDVTAGATIKNLVGVLDYGYRRYTLLVDPASPPTVEGMKSYLAVSPAGEREFTIGSFNIENFFDDEKNSDNVDKETVYSKEYFQKRLNKASLAIRKVLGMPDVLGVEECENLKALKKLAVKINADAVAAGLSDPKYDAYLEEGNDVRGIDSGFLVKTTKVKVLETKQLAKDVSLDFKDAVGDQKLFDRPPFMIRVQVIDAKSSDPLTVTVIVNHLKSYLGIDSEKDGPRVREKRKQEAEWLANFVAERAKADPNEKVLVCGDFNAYLFSDGYNDLIGTLKGKPDQRVTNPSKTYATGLFDLADFIRDAGNRYSYVHDGSMQVLDHVLVNKPLSNALLKFGYARVDADFPVVWTADDTRPERLSDHDAPVAFFSLDPKPAAAIPTASPTPIKVPPIP
ncbi:MAG TPA: endonuclease/exonuclease/phosphatase family protein [Pyrinomonadaceae bacterium]|nr:endonuclease/exonuclease/phosphatase family protein [Pyrinomonadaceae bacterium]